MQNFVTGEDLEPIFRLLQMLEGRIAAIETALANVNVVSVPPEPQPQQNSKLPPKNR